MKRLLFSAILLFFSIYLYSQSFGDLGKPDDYYETIEILDVSEELPNDWDWRNEIGEEYWPKAKNQGSCNSCWAFAATGAFTAKVNYDEFVMIGIGDQWLSVSQQILCNDYMGGCNGGTMKCIYYWMIKQSQRWDVNNGPMLWDCTGYDPYDTTCDEI